MAWTLCAFRIAAINPGKRRSISLQRLTLRMLYPAMETGPGDTVSEHAKRALHTDWPSELAYELWKISRNRAHKSDRSGRFWASSACGSLP